MMHDTGNIEILHCYCRHYHSIAHSDSYDDNTFVHVVHCGHSQSTNKNLVHVGWNIDFQLMFHCILQNLSKKIFDDVTDHHFRVFT